MTKSYTQMDFGPANFEKNIAFTVNTPADTGSMTKTLTAAAIFKLIEKGQMRLTDSISTYLPELKYPSIQVKHLLGHSSGIAGDGYFFEKAPRDSIIDNAFFFNILINERPPLTFPPGERFEYSNVNYVLLAMIIERVAREDYASFLKRHFLQPLYLNSSFVRPPLFKDWPGVRTLGYDLLNKTKNDSEDQEGFYGCCNVFLSRWTCINGTRHF